MSYPFGLVVPLHQFRVLSNLTTGLQLLTTPPNPGASISNMNSPSLASNNLGDNLCMLLMAALLTTSKLLRWFRCFAFSAWAFQRAYHTCSGYGCNDITHRLYCVNETPVKYEPPRVARW